MNATATGDRQALTISLQAAGAQTAANATAKVELSGDDLIVGLTRFDGRYGAIPVALAGPTRVHIAGPRIAIEPTNLRVGGGRLSVRGTLAPSGSDLQLEVAALPLSLIDAFAPGTNLDGTLQTKLRVQGSMDAPVVDGTYNVTGLRAASARAALVPPVVGAGIGLADGPASQHRCAGERKRHEPDAEGQGDAAAGRARRSPARPPSAGPWSWRPSRRCWATTSATSQAGCGRT